MKVEEDPRTRLYENMQRRSIPGMDGLRGAAALTVVLFHGVNQHFPGRQAVQMFFVLSGLLVTWLLLAEEKRCGDVNLRAFYLRRVLRLFPPLAALLVWEIMTDKPHVTAEAMLGAAFYYANYLAAFGTDLLGLVHTWSLSVEEHFYFLWPATFALVRNRAQLTRALILIAVASVAYRITAARLIGLSYAGDATECNMTGLALGCAMALSLWQSHKRIPCIVLHPVLTPVAVLVIVALGQVSTNSQIVWAIPASVPFAAIVLLQAITYEWRILENSVARFLGRISYGIYLWHLVGIALLDGVWTGPLATYARPFTVIALATLSYFAIERPIQSAGRQWIAAAVAKRNLTRDLG